MSTRSAIILLQDSKIALIERHRQGLHYFTFPGGHVQPGETPEQAAVRETMEELGLEVRLKQLAVKAFWQGKWQYYFTAEAIGGTFGSGCGEEMNTPRPERGTYRPVWLALADLVHQPIKPANVAEQVSRYASSGWPEETLVLLETAT